MQPFQRLRVDYVVSGGARIWWDLDRHFTDPGPYIFQLQTGHTGLQDADDWIDVGVPVVDTYMTFDLQKRQFGKTLDEHYRVKLTTPNGNYTSMTTPTDGLLAKRDWLKYREVSRKEQLRHRVQTSPKGFLLKARRYGPRCTDCTDSLTEEITQTNCSNCYGTGFENGYFEPLAACYADVALEQNREHRDPNVGMQKQDTVTARFIGDPQLYSYDVWCNATSDERYYIHTVVNKAHIRGVILIYEAELRLAPFSDVIYTFPLETEPPLLAEYEEPTWMKRQSKPELNYLEAAMREMKERRSRSSRS